LRKRTVGVIDSYDGVQGTARPTEFAFAAFVEVGILPAVEPGAPPGAKDGRINANLYFLQWFQGK